MALAASGGTVDGEGLHEVVRRLRQVQALLQVVDRLDAGGVPSLVIKGEATRAALYAPEESRPTADVDLLVPESRIAEVDTALVADGWAPVLRGARPDEVSPHSRDWFRGSGHSRVDLDLHTSFHGVTASPGTLFETWSASAEPLDLGPRTVQVPSSETTALIVALHRTRTLTGSKAAEDLRRALDRFPAVVWQRAADQAWGLGCQQAMSAGLRTSAAGTRLAVALGLPAPGLRERLQHRDVEPLAAGVLRLAEAPGLRARWSIVRDEVACSDAFLRQQYPYAWRGRGWQVLARAHRVLDLSRRTPGALVALSGLRGRDPRP